MAADSASRASIVAVPNASPEDLANAERFRDWQRRNEVTSLRDARRARIAFTVVVLVVGAWFAIQLLAPSFWP
jgi:hypothetical protein